MSFSTFFFLFLLYLDTFFCLLSFSLFIMSFAFCTSAECFCVCFLVLLLSLSGCLLWGRMENWVDKWGGCRRIGIWESMIKVYYINSFNKRKALKTMGIGPVNTITFWAFRILFITFMNCIILLLTSRSECFSS